MISTTRSRRAVAVVALALLLASGGPVGAQGRTGNLSSIYYGGPQPVQPQYHPTYSNYGWTHFYNYYPHYGEYRYGYPYYSYNYGYPLNSTAGYSGSDAFLRRAEDYGDTGSRSYYTGPGGLPPRAPQPPDTTARITVHVPADADVWFDGTKTTSTGAVREYQTPALRPGHQYAYEVRARWTDNGREVSQTQKVQVVAGNRLDVTFPVASGTDNQGERPREP